MHHNHKMNSNLSNGGRGSQDRTTVTQCSQEHLLTSFSDDVTTRYSEQAQHLVSLGLTKQSSFFTLLIGIGTETVLVLNVQISKVVVIESIRLLQTPRLESVDPSCVGSCVSPHLVQFQLQHNVNHGNMGDLFYRESTSQVYFSGFIHVHAFQRLHHTRTDCVCDFVHAA